MRFLCLYTADQLSEPSPAHMAERGRYMEREMKSGRLIDAGGLKRRDADGFTVRKKGSDYVIGHTGAPWAAATGWAIIQAPTRERAIADIQEFLGLAGDGISEVIQISDPAPQQ
ncbi:MAG: hypothetical protein HY054_09395 [Proteobacteria bacterium]|nr:hypothetical protein [Pseudomonadota bacterium]